MELRVLRYFVAVAEAGSLTAGADAVRISQPAVSRQLRALERELGADLFTRGNGPLRLTRAGDRMLVVARDLLRRDAMARQILRIEDHTDLSGTPDLTVVAPLATLHDMLAPLIAERGASLPVIDGIEMEPAAVFDQIHALGADLGLSTYPPPAGWRSRRLPDIPLYAQVAHDHPYAGLPRVELTDLLNDPLIVMNRTNMARLVVDEALAALDRSPAHLIEMRSSLLAQGVAASGRGVALLTNWPRFDLATVPVTVTGQPVRIPMYAGWDPTHYAADVLTRLIDEIEVFCGRVVNAIPPRAS
ncbi:LysR family transcriptional regulator [Actinoplanes couchii]|uniref:LysR family transcriptional regulator n=1 Tax=Actinoplanes couchii TaxID=403638 RepID=A0ABQ3XGF3_9ACTN|nr:LysR family transcriptional regulator [Actinoplanes couchii]MDR6321064.1 DNA-binding transcriptional LysR family regulator [Actinoplanes couchii]GID57575.1 LysR family transcriptional regulator [Actinoplanes couchii]